MKKILVVGGNSFIGKSAADHLEKHGYACIRTSRKKTDHHSHYLDLENEDSIRKFAADQDALDGIIFSQGINPSVNTKDTSLEHFSRMLHINLTAPALLIKHLHTRLNEGAHILFFSSVAATKGSYDPSYASAKAGIAGLMQSLANEFPMQRFNIISPGLVENSPVFNGMTPDFREKHAQRMNNRFITASDISSMILELFSNQSVNRAIINMDSGFKS